MELIPKYFWIVLIVASVYNLLASQARIERGLKPGNELAEGYRRLFRGVLIWSNIPWVLMGVGILAGQVGSIFEFTMPSHGNPYVVFWFLAVAAELALGTWWLLLAGGAETLEKHPGVYMIPMWTAKTLKRVWLALLAVYAAAFLLPYVGLGSVGSKDAWRTFMERAFPILFPFYFVGLFMLISTVLAAISGWSVLKRYYVAKAFTGKLHRFRSGNMNGVRFSRSLSLGADTEGLYLSAFILMRFSMPALYIPWSDITARKTSSWGFSMLELKFDKAPYIALRLRYSDAEMLYQEAGRSNVLSASA